MNTRVYNLAGYSLLLLHAAVSILLAPPSIGPWWGFVIGMGYLTLVWFSGGIYLSDIVHMGIAHRALNYKPWFIKTVTMANSLVGIHVSPAQWVNRHRHHHEFSDHPGDPNKLSEDGFWKTMMRIASPYPCRSDWARDPILTSWPMRVASSRIFALVAHVSSFALVWWAVRDWRYALALWLSVRIFGLWVNMIQNFWTHDRRFGTRRYHDEHDNAMNIGDWLPVTATFSACWQNNHHHYPHLLRLSHDDAEYDFGFLTVRAMKRLGVVEASPTGARKPEDLPLRALGL